MINRVPNLLPLIKNNHSRHTKIYPEFTHKLKFDGCSKGNPGLSGAGAVIYEQDVELWSDCYFVSEKATNNFAEYSGLILGLTKAIDMNIKTICVEGDSLLVINQMKGLYKCNSENLVGLYNVANILVERFETIHFNHVLRADNKKADELANQAVIKYLQK
jgi:ribonuclease HI